MRSLAVLIGMCVVAANAGPIRAADHPEIRTELVAQDAGQPESLALFHGESGTAGLVLRGADARQQLIVTGSFATGVQRDLTHQVEYAVSPAGVVEVDQQGLVMAVGDGA